MIALDQAVVVSLAIAHVAVENYTLTGGVLTSKDFTKCL
jgi:hypothetical protein